MNLYLLERLDDAGYDEFDSIVVAAATQQAACVIRPRGGWIPDNQAEDGVTLRIALIGTTHLPTGIVHTSFNAG